MRINILSDIHHLINGFAKRSQNFSLRILRTKDFRIVFRGSKNVCKQTVNLKFLRNNKSQSTDVFEKIVRQLALANQTREGIFFKQKKSKVL